MIQLKDLKILNKDAKKYVSPKSVHSFRKHLVILMKMGKLLFDNGKERCREGTAAMGMDAPISVLSQKRQPLFGYFKQLFAQVTNPPIDAIREEVVTSTTIYVGTDGNLLEQKEENCKMLRVNNPILTNTDLLKIKNMKVDGFKVAEIPITYYKNTSLEKAIEYLFIEVDRVIREGANILILTDREVDEYHVAIPSLLAVSGLQQHLVRTKKRTSVAMILESGEPREDYHLQHCLDMSMCD